MSTIKADFSKMKSSGQEELNLARELRQIESELYSILSSLSMHSASASKIRGSLRSKIQKVSTSQEKLNVLYNGLMDIVQLYLSSENTASNGIEGKALMESTAETIGKAWKKLESLRKQHGIQPLTAYSKDPVNLSTGNYVYEKVCMELDAELDMKFRIFYNAQNEGTGSLGQGWTHTWEVSLAHSAEGISMILDDSSRYSFMEKDGSFVAAPGTAARFRREDGLDIVTDRQGRSFYFQSSGCLVRMEDLIGAYIVLEYDEKERLCRVTDRRGNFFQFTHDEAGHLQKVEDSAGRSVLLSWKEGRLSGVMDPQGRKTAYRYEEHGWLTKVINARGMTCLVNTYDDHGRIIGQRFPDGGEMRYEYLDEKNQIMVTEQNGGQVIYEHDEFMRSTRTIYADGEETSEFDGNNNRIASTDKRGNTSRYTYDHAGNILSFTNALNDELAFSYNAKNQITQVELNGTMIHRADYNERNLQVETENANGAVDRYEYDQYGQPVVWARADGSQVNLTYDDMGNLASITNAAGGCTRYEYNDKNQVIKTIDPLGHETFYAYNQADELIMVRDAAGNIQSFDYDTCGNVILARDESGAETVAEYNAMNKPIRIIGSDGAETVYEYDTMWNVTSVTAPDGGKTTYEYDQLQRLVKVTDANGGINRMVYDACGNLIRRTDPEGGIHQLEYDALNRPNRVCDPAGMEVRAEYDALGNVTAVLYPDGSCERYEYDLMSNMVMSQDRGGYRKFYEYNILGDLAVVSDPDGILEEYTYYPGGLLKSETYADGRSRHFFYDDNENVVKIVNQDGNQWEFIYDSMGRVVTASQEQGVKESYEYDALGNITTVTDGNGVTTVYGYSGRDIISVTDGMGGETRCLYDPCRRLTRVIQSNEKLPNASNINAFNRSQKNIRITDFRYDKNGNIVGSIDPEGNQTCYTYDRNNRIRTQTEADRQETRCEYYLDGMVKSFHFADGRFVKMMYDPLKRLVEMEDWLGVTRVQPDVMGRPRQVTDPNGDIVSYEWGQRGECKETVYPDGTKVSYTYDEGLHLLRSQIGDDPVSYQYYPNGKLKEKILPDEIKACYQYNPAGYVSGITCIKGDEIIDTLRYEYDRNGRKSRISRRRLGMEDSGIYEYIYNATGSLTSVIKDGSQIEVYEYDGYGNRTFARSGGRESRYSYNRLNQLICMWDEDGEHAYSYDCRGNLLSEKLNETLMRSLDFNAQGLLEKVKTAGKTISYEYDGLGNRVRQWVTEDNVGSKGSSFLYDMTRDYPHLLAVKEDGRMKNLIWDGGLLGCRETDHIRYFLNDERMSPLRIIEAGSVCRSMSFDSFGNVLENVGTGTEGVGYAGYRSEPSGFMYVNARDYDARNGRFISRDLFSGILTLPITFNAYSYAMGDPINRVDPTGMIAAWLGAGIVGAVTNIVTKIAGDVVESVSTGKIHVSSWQSYVGAATGGFTYGTVFVATGNLKTAGAASAAVESFTTNGLSMLTGKEGYRAEDGYSWNNLLGSTVKDGLIGAGSGYLFGKAGKYIKLPGINKGRGSFQAVWKQVMTKASKGQIANITLKTLGKGLVAYGGIHLADQIVQKSWKKLMDTGKKLLSNQVEKILGGHRGSARCPAEG